MGILAAFFQRSKPPSADLVAEIEQLKSDIRILKTEWSEVYDKMLHALDRINKRNKQLVVEKEPEIPADDMVSLWQECRRKGLVS